MRTLRLASVLVFHDEPQVVEARDSIGGHYLGILSEEAGFTVCGISPETLERFKRGETDLLSAILARPDDLGWFEATLDETLRTLELSEPILSPISEDRLPGPGFTLLAEPVPAP